MVKDELVTVRVGKNGLTTQLIDEIKSVLKKRKIVRVKMLKSALTNRDKKEMAEAVRKSCKAKRAGFIGHTITLEK